MNSSTKNNSNNTNSNCNNNTSLNHNNTSSNHNNQGKKSKLIILKDNVESANQWKDIALPEILTVLHLQALLEEDNDNSIEPQSPLQPMSKINTKKISERTFGAKKSVLISAMYEAFTHASSGKGIASFENLAFVGDAVLGQIVTLWVYRYLREAISQDHHLLFSLKKSQTPTDTTEAMSGAMSEIRSILVRRTECAYYLDSLGLTKFIIVGAGSEKERLNFNVQAEIMEALLGAIVAAFGDTEGYRYCRYIVEQILVPLHFQKVKESIVQSTHVNLARTESENFQAQSLVHYYVFAEPLKEQLQGFALCKRLYSLISTLPKTQIQQIVQRRKDLHQQISKNEHLSEMMEILRATVPFSSGIPHNSLVCAQYVIFGSLDHEISSPSQVGDWLYLETYLVVYLGNSVHRRLEDTLQHDLGWNWPSESKSSLVPSGLVDSVPQWQAVRNKLFQALMTEYKLHTKKQELFFENLLKK